MEQNYSKSNTIRTSYVGGGLTGVQKYSQEIQYSVDLGTILYNNSFKNLNSLVIPLKDQQFFDLPQDKDKYAVINVYYDAENGKFVFDKIGVYDKYVEKATAPALFNVIPIAQFILRQSQNSYEVVSYNEYSQMSTFSITDTYEQGDTGIKADSGLTGPLGCTGLQGAWGWTGPDGLTGLQGLTGLSATGIAGIPGETGVPVDSDILLYLKFKTSDAKQTDFSIYQRDCTYEYTGIVDDNGDPLSYYTKESGVVDNCHNIVYGGGSSVYRRNEFFEFGGETGTISSWIKLTQKPIVDFTYTIDEDNPRTVHFKDASTKQPSSWTWWMDYNNIYPNEEQGVVIHEKNAGYTFPVAGTYIVRLRVSNANGYNEISKFITV